MKLITNTQIQRPKSITEPEDLVSLNSESKKAHMNSVTLTNLLQEESEELKAWS